jgi:lipopolysaccharide transport system permease protein
MTEKIIIERGRAARNYWNDLWRYRELFLILSWRDISVRYKQTFFGVAWSVLRPLLTMVVFTFVFGRFAKLPSEGNAPYAIMIFAGLLPWQFFSNAVSEAGSSLVSNANLITKVYFPRLIIPASSVIVSFIDFLVAFILLLFLFLFYRFVPSWRLVFLPLFILLAFLFSFGVSLLITSLNVKYRDFRYIIPFIIQFGLFISPVGFSSNIVPEELQLLYSLNPMVGVINGFRWCIIGEDTLPWKEIAIAIIITLFFLWAGLKHFRLTEKSFADNI